MKAFQYFSVATIGLLIGVYVMFLIINKELDELKQLRKDNAEQAAQIQVYRLMLRDHLNIEL